MALDLETRKPAPNGHAVPADDDVPFDPRDEDAPPEAAAEPVMSPPWEQFVAPVTAEWFTKVPAPRAWLLRDARRDARDGVLPLGKVGQLIAAGGIGKTMLLVQLAIAVASGSSWLDSFSVAPEGKGRVLLVLGEEDAEEVQRRVYNAQRNRDGRPDDGAIVVLPLQGIPCAMLERDDRGNAVEAPFLAWLRTFLAGTPAAWRLIVVDPLSRFGGPDCETDNAVGTRFVQALESLATVTGATVLFSHHTNKLARRDGAEVTGAMGRGSSSLFDGARWEASLGVETVKLEDPETRERLGELVQLAFTKSNYSRRADPVSLRRAAGGPLVPLDEADQETVAAAKDTSGKRTEAKAKATRQRDEEDDLAARALLQRYPSATVRDLVAHLKRERSCGSDRAHDSIRRVRAST